MVEAKLYCTCLDQCSLLVIKDVDFVLVFLRHVKLILVNDDAGEMAR